MYDFGETLRRLRKYKNLTQKRLAEKLDVTEGTISKYESNQVYPPFETLRSIAVILNVSMDELCGLPTRDCNSFSGLSDEQIKIMNMLTEAFRCQNMHVQKNMYKEQFLILSQIANQFSK